MRALMLTPDEGHLDRRIAQEAGTLAAHGWEVDIYPAVDPGLDYEADLPPGVRLLVNPRPIRAAGSGRGTLRRVKRTVVRVMPPAGRIIEWMQYRTRDIGREIADANLSSLAGLGRFDLIFAHDVPVMPLAATLKAAWGSPLISDLHEVFPEQDAHFTTRTARRYWRRLEAGGLAASDGIICVNVAVAEYVRTTHAPTAPIAVIHNSVPYVKPSPSDTTLRTYYSIPDGARIMLFVGSLRPHMNLELVIEAFAAANIDGWVLTILGEGPLQSELDAMVRRRHLEGRVFLGRHVRQSDLIQVAASADIALIPYRAFGFNYLIATPNKLFEYIQARLPIATSRLPMIERIVSVHGNGAFVDFSTSASLAGDLVAFVRDIAPAITPATLEAAAREFSWENEEDALLSLTGRVMAQPTNSPDRSRTGDYPG
jgi:glycosyltransferase involved in cell wall biosynthesis